jgi:hypothetical protein
MYEIGDLVRRAKEPNGRRFKEGLGIVVKTLRQKEGGKEPTVEVDWGDGYVLSAPLRWIEKCSSIPKRRIEYASQAE